MSSAAWMLVEPAKYEDVMAEFRANGKDSDSSSSTSRGSSNCSTTATTTPLSETTPPITNSTLVSHQPTPCTQCGLIPPSPNDFTSRGPAIQNIPPLGTNNNLTDASLIPGMDAFEQKFRRLLSARNTSWPLTNIDMLNTFNRSGVTSPMNNLNLQLQLQQLRAAKNGCMECVFCRNNGEQVAFYRSHELKDEYGRVICPVLRAFKCPCCGATGDNAHTIKYCPEKGANYLPTLASLKSLKMASKRRIPPMTRRMGSQDFSGWISEEQ